MFGSITRLIQSLQSGNDSAFEPLYAKLLPRLTSYTNRRYGDLRSLSQDGADIAQCAFLSLWHAVEDQGRLVTQLSNRQSLWQVLLTLARQKVRRARRDGMRQKRDYRRTLLASDVMTGGMNPWEASITSETEVNLPYQAIVEEWLNPLTQEQRVIVNLKLIAATNAEVAWHLGVSERAVERQLSEIRSIWKEKRKYT